jgi:uncharacterized protein YgiM (DUF1202 family)
MKNQGVKIALIIFGVLALGAGAYFIFKPKKDDLLDDNDDKDDKDDKDDDDKKFEKYIIATQKGNLNLRDIPSTSGNIKQSLPKGTEILARPSEKEGWHEVSDDGKKIVGFVSSQYITKK